MPHNKCSIAAVTALAFLDDLIIAGEGSLLKIYCCTSSKCVLQERMFGDQIVHGIAISSDQVGARTLLVWGGTLSRVVTLCWEGLKKLVNSSLKDARLELLDTAIYD